MQSEGTAISEKEATWSAFGMDSGFLGGRYDLVIWDDVVDPTKTRTREQVDYQRAWWGDVAESRLEPGGLLIIQGQRIGAEDLYRYCLDMKVPTFQSEQDEDEEEVADWVPKYHHIKFKAHYEEKCQGAVTHQAQFASVSRGLPSLPPASGLEEAGDPHGESQRPLPGALSARGRGPRQSMVQCRLDLWTRR